MESRVLQQGRARFLIDLHPAHTSNPLGGIRQLLDPRLLRWDNELDGILLAYKNIQRLPSQAVIRPYFPYIHLQIQADVLVFKPRVGSVICGQVTKLGADFIGMTILGALNAAIGRQHIRPGLQYSREEEVWREGNDLNSTIGVGTAVTFAVEGLCIEKSGICAIMGSLAEPWSGSCRAAARKQPAAFPDPHRWQQHQAAGVSLVSFSGPSEPGGDASKASVPANIPADPSQRSSKGKKKAKRKAADIEEVAPASPLPINPDAMPSGVKQKKKKRKTDPLPSPSREDLPSNANNTGIKKKKKKKDKINTSGIQIPEAQQSQAAEGPELLPDNQLQQPVPEKQEGKKKRKKGQPDEHDASVGNGYKVLQDPVLVEATELPRKGKKKHRLSKLHSKIEAPPSILGHVNGGLEHRVGSTEGSQLSASHVKAAHEHRTAEKRKKKDKNRLSNVTL